MVASASVRPGVRATEMPPVSRRTAARRTSDRRCMGTSLRKRAPEIVLAGGPGLQPRSPLLLLLGHLGAQALLPLAQLGGEFLPEVRGLEDLPDLQLDIPVAVDRRPALGSVDGLLQRIHLNQPIAGDQLLGLGEGSVGDARLAPREL